MYVCISVCPFLSVGFCLLGHERVLVARRCTKITNNFSKSSDQSRSKICKRKSSEMFAFLGAVGSTLAAVSLKDFGEQLIAGRDVVGHPGRLAGDTPTLTQPHHLAMHTMSNSPKCPVTSIGGQFFWFLSFVVWFEKSSLCPLLPGQFSSSEYETPATVLPLLWEGNPGPQIKVPTT